MIPSFEEQGYTVSDCDKKNIAATENMATKETAQLRSCELT